MKKNVLIIHFNTPKLTECLVKSIEKYTPGCNIYIFDNSDKYPFTYSADNITIFDNTKGQIVDLDKMLENYPNRYKSFGRKSNFGSARHCKSVDACMHLIEGGFVLMDSDIIIKQDISDLFDDTCMFIGQIEDWSWGPHHEVNKRLLPFICYINNDLANKEGITYFDDHHMAGLYNPDFSADSFDTGGYFYLKTKEYPHREINWQEYAVHFHGGSYTNTGRDEKMSVDEWLSKYKKHWNTPCKKVIYTCITGNYDNLIEMQTYFNDYDYICFTNNPDIKSDSWIIKPIPKLVLSNQKKQRYVKMHPHKLLPEYDYSIYVDANIDILKDPTPLIHNEYFLQIPMHPDRNCLYKEYKACVIIKKDTLTNMKPQIDRYREEGFPEKYGLTQNNIIFRKHNDPKCIELMELWWKEVFKGSYRDQISFEYVLWKFRKTNTDKILIMDKNISDSAYFKWYKYHGNIVRPERKEPAPVNKIVSGFIPAGMKTKPREVPPPPSFIFTSPKNVKIFK